MQRVHRALFLLLTLAFVLGGCLGQSGTNSEDGQTAKSIRAPARDPPVYPGTYKFDGAYAQVLAPGPYKSKDPVHLLLPSGDGIDIEIAYWLPDVPEELKVPVIVQASPYYNLGADLPGLGGNLLMLQDNFVPHGYAVAAVSVLGTGNSGGCMDLMGPLEVAHLDDAITWLGSQEWSNGNVGMIGLSYDGSTPWDVAATGNPHLKTIVPISGLPDIFGLGYRNGSSENRMAGLVSGLYYGTNLAPAVSTAFAGEMPTRVADRTLCPESWKGFAASFTALGTGERDPLGFWADRNRKPLIEEHYRGSIFHIQGLQDWNVDPSLTIPWTSFALNASGVPLKMLLGQWGHAYPDQFAPPDTMRWDWAEVLLHWFDHELKEMTQVDTGPAVQVQDDKLAWRNEESWPPHDTQWTTRHLAEQQKLDETPGAAGAIQLVPNPVGDAVGPEFRSLPYQSADFFTPPMTDDLRLAGLPRLHVTLVPQGPSGHVAAWLYDVDGDVETRIGWTTMNLWYHEGGETRKQLTPEVPILAKMEFQPLDAVVPAGHRLMVRLWQYSSEDDRLPAIPPEPIEVLYGGSSTSILELPVIQRTPDAFFEPPMPPAG